MLKNFFKTAIRSIQKNKAYAFINFIGLTCGLSLALLIMSYVRSELSYDQFHEKAEQLYRIKYTAPNGLELASTPPPIAPLMKEFFPGVEEAARLYGRNVSVSKQNGEESFEEENIFFADSAIMNMFSFSFVDGNASKALREKFTVIITEEMAKKYFGNKDPMGESLLFGGKVSFKIAGVVKSFPESSHIRFNMLVPYENMYDLESPEAAAALKNNLAVNFVISHSYTYVLLTPGADPKNIDNKMGDFVKKYAKPQLQVGQVFTLMPLTDIHLHSTLLAEPSATNSMTNLYIFIGVGILTLLIACINYINLSTAQSFSRIKEIGIRKILGSLKSQLIGQFLSESFLFCTGAIAVSYFILYATLPLLNELTNKNLVYGEAVDATMIVASLILLLVMTLLAGGYPAYFVTKFNSVNSIKGGANNMGSQTLRRALVVFQLCVACMLLSGSLLIVKQLNFLSSRPLGFQKEQVINVPLFSNNLNGIFRQNDSTFWVRLQSYRDVIEAQAGIKQTTLSSNAPGLGAVFRGTVPEGFTQEDRLFIANLAVDHGFLQSYGMELVAGRGFSRENKSDIDEAFIVNETAVNEFKWETPEKALGKTINLEGKKGKVIGVIKDFNFTALTTPVSSMVLDIEPNQFNMLSVKFDNGNVQQTIDKLREEWSKMFPEKTFEFTFLDEQINQQYENYQNFGSIIQAFTFIAIIISCLGVYGLVLFIVQRKVREIGVRKVLGATIINILRLIFKDFAWLVLLGFVLAIPISYYLINRWMENFTYHTTVDAISYIVSFAIVLLVVSATIGYQAIKASIANPVTSLRSE
ncbi:ABC transporter permease [Chryseosolibacter indicus]|uniref:ABC transporter permease n=1 Tax=Chryseosolibacter indicus TaxID=2782351 RepID=A0ABS5VPI5_9BACT|nr:ABC transporter permease [Chryseosolibacter indicus]MBT1703344.1 ABC transporter permease [Chryseosolibacter indicus]